MQGNGTRYGILVAQDNGTNERWYEKKEAT